MIRELDKTIDWEIEDKSVFSGDQIGLNKIEGYKAIIRDDNGEILSVMKKSYSPMNNSEFLLRFPEIRSWTWGNRIFS